MKNEASGKRGSSGEKVATDITNAETNKANVKTSSPEIEDGSFTSAQVDDTEEDVCFGL